MQKNHGHVKTRPRKFSGAEGGTRTPTMFPTSDFESDASAIPPLRHIHIDESYSIIYKTISQSIS